MRSGLHAGWSGPTRALKNQKEPPSAQPWVFRRAPGSAELARGRARALQQAQRERLGGCARRRDHKHIVHQPQQHARQVRLPAPPRAARPLRRLPLRAPRRRPSRGASRPGRPDPLRPAPSRRGALWCPAAGAASGGAASAAAVGGVLYDAGCGRGAARRMAPGADAARRRRLGACARLHACDWTFGTASQATHALETARQRTSREPG